VLNIGYPKIKEGSKMAYPTKLRERAIQALRNGYTREEVTKIYGLGQHTLWDWEKLEAETGTFEKRPLKRKARKIEPEKLLEYYRENPLSTNKEAAIAFECSVSGIRSAKRALKITRKKRLFNM
jgi:transposase